MAKAPAERFASMAELMDAGDAAFSKVISAKDAVPAIAGAAAADELAATALVESSPRVASDAVSANVPSLPIAKAPASARRATSRFTVIHALGDRARPTPC